MLGIGKFIKAKREELKLSQEELCYGICSASTLSKIEKGSQNPTRATFEALMERMGQSKSIYPSFLSDIEKRAFELKYDFNELYAKEMYDEAEKVLNKLNELPKLDSVYDQFIRLCNVLIKQQKGLPAEEAVKELGGIINVFIKDFSPEKIRNGLFTKTEINMLNSYALANHQAGYHELAIDILKELVLYIEYKVYDSEGIAIVYTKILSNLAKYVGMSGDDEEAVRLCEKGIKNCIRYHRYNSFPDLLYFKGFGLMNMGQTEEAHQCIQECFYIERAMGEQYAKNHESTKRYAKERCIKLV